MSVIDDTRKVFQDLIAPDLKAIDARLTSLEEKMEIRFVGVDSRFASADQLATVRHEALVGMIAKSEANVLNAINLEKRLARLEDQRDVKTQ